MTWPSADVTTTNLDAGTDNPATARGDLLDLAQKFNQLRAHVSSFIQGLLDDTTAAGARTTLGATTVGANVFTATDAAAARGSSILDVPSRGELQTQTYTAFTTGGTATAYTLTPSPVISAYANGQRFRVKFHAANTSTTPTMTVNGVGAARNLKVYDSTGAKVNPAVGAFAANMLADVEVDGTDMVVLDQLPPAVSVAPNVRQTVLSGPVDANGAANFLPATSGTLSLTSSGLTSRPLVVAAANGFNANGAVDRIGYSAVELTWSSLTASQTCYLYVDVAANGTLTTGHTTLAAGVVAPIYQQGGTRSIVLNQFQFNISEMSATVGNGTVANQTWRVYVGECVTSGTGVTSSISYAYRGEFEGTELTPSQTSGSLIQSSNHNIGVTPRDFRSVLRNKTAELGYSVGDEVPVAHVLRSGVATQGGVMTESGGRNVMRTENPDTGEVLGLRDLSATTTGVTGSITLGSWRIVHRASRGW